MNSQVFAQRSCPRQATGGFTLIELLIVVTIVAILTAVSVPSYRNYVVRTHRNAAKACLAEHAQFLERYYTSNLTYVGADPALACQTESNMNDRYTFAASDLTQGTYTVTATPKDAQASSDDNCSVLGLDQSGTRSATGTGGVAECW